MTPLLNWHLLAMDFGKRLAALRKQHSMTQQALADAVDAMIDALRTHAGPNGPDSAAPA